MINTVPVFTARDPLGLRTRTGYAKFSPVYSVHSSDGRADGTRGIGSESAEWQQTEVNSELQHRSSCREELGVGRVG